jgi:hypothetical protein
MPDPIVTDVAASHKSPSLLDYLDRPIAFHRAFATLAGSAAGGLMLAQAFYWTRLKLRDQPASGGWFWKTQEDWTEETALSHHEQLTVRKRLQRMPFWHERRQGIPAKLFYRVDLQELEKALLELPAPRPLRGKKSQPDHQITEIRQTSLPPSGALDNRDPVDQFTRIRSTITEITPETSPESLPEIDHNVGSNVGVKRRKPDRPIRLTPRQEEALEELETQLDPHSRGAFAVIVSDHGLGEERALSLLREAMEIEAAGQLKTTLSQCFMDLCHRDAGRQGIDLGFKRS